MALYAIRTERALITADARFHGLRRKVFVAVLAVGSDIQRHSRPTLHEITELDARKSTIPRKRQIGRHFCKPRTFDSESSPCVSEIDPRALRAEKNIRLGKSFPD